MAKLYGPMMRMQHVAQKTKIRIISLSHDTAIIQGILVTGGLLRDIYIHEPLSFFMI